MPHNPVSSGSSRRPSSRHATDYLRVLYKRRWVAIPGFLLVFLSGAIGSVRTVPIYQAQTQLLIEKDARRATSLNTVLQDPDTWYQDDFYPTQYRILQSRSLALRTAKALDTAKPEHVPPASGLSFSLSGLVSAGFGKLVALVSRPAVSVPANATPSDAAAASALADRVLGGLTIVPIRNSRLVDVQFRSPDPEFAATVANTLATQYIQQSVQFRDAATSETDDWLKSQLAQQRKLVEESDLKLQQYKEQHNAGAVDDKQNIVVQKLNALNQQLVQARIERMDREATYSTLVSLQQKGEDLGSFPAVMASEVVQKLKADIVEKENERAKLSTQYGPAYPAMRDLTQQIATAQHDLQVEIGKVVASIKTEYLAAKAKEDSLQQSLDNQQQASLGLDRKMMAYAALEREADSNRQLYNNLLMRTKETSAAGEYRGTNIRVLDQAEVPKVPVLPQTGRDVLVAAFGGSLLALGLAFGFEYFDSRIKTPEEIKTYLDLPFLGLVPAFTGPDRNGEAPLLHPDAAPAFSEAIRAVRTAVLFSSADEGARSVVITSTGPHEGKTLVSSSLAITLAQAGQRTIVVDCDMRRPRMHEALGRSQEPGLSNVLVGEATLADATRATSVPNLSMLAAGHIPPNPVELLCSAKFADLVTELKRRFDWVVIDAPPVMPVTDAAVVANTASGVLFVVGSEMTSRQSAAAAVEQLRGANAKFIGAVLNRVNVRRHCVLLLDVLPEGLRQVLPAVPQPGLARAVVGGACARAGRVHGPARAALRRVYIHASSSRSGPSAGPPHRARARLGPRAARRALGVPRTALLPRLARGEGALQADHPRHRLGRDPAGDDDGGLHRVLREARQDLDGRYPVSGLHLLRAAAVAAVRVRAHRIEQQRGRQPAPPDEGLLPASGPAAGLGVRRRRGLRDCVRRPVRTDVLLRDRPGAGRLVDSALGAAGPHVGRGREPVALLTERQVP